MMVTASSSISWRSAAGGHFAPVTCSLSASPVPTPRVNLPPVSRLAVAAAWAMTAGWTRVVGQVTAVVTGRLVTCDIAPMTDQTKLDCPCSSSHGWKWSEIHRRVESGLFSHLGLPDQAGGLVLFAGKEVSVTHARPATRPS